LNWEKLGYVVGAISSAVLSAFLIGKIAEKDERAAKIVETISKTGGTIYSEKSNS